MAEAYQLIVIGGGPGGYIAAVEAAKLGKKVALMEQKALGGTCLNQGCIPTKALIHATDVLTELKNVSHLGIDVGPVSYDFGKIHARKDEVVATLRSGVESLMASNKITVITGTATILTATTVAVGDALYEAENIIIATGASPFLPPIEGIASPTVMSSDHLLTGSPTLYQQLVIIGGGVIGVEFATIYNALGCDVTILEAKSRNLPTMDKEISQSLTMVLKKRGVNIHTAAMVEKIEDVGNTALCHFTVKDKANVVPADGILVAVGRRANIDKLFGADFAIEIEGGMIPVDQHNESSVKGVFAIGDVIKGGIQLAHMASAQAINVIASLYGVAPVVDLSIVPACIYTNPEIASVGLSLEAAKTQGIPVKTNKYLLSSNGKSLITSAERGFIKIIYHEETLVLLGAQLMCSRATDMIGELTTAVVNKLTIKDLASVIRPHPTYCEGISEVALHALAKESL